MIVLEQKFMEQVPGALLRIAKALESVILWLEQHGRCGLAKDHPVYKCIEKIIKS